MLSLDDTVLDPFDPFQRLHLDTTTPADSHAPVVVLEKDAKKRPRSHVDPEAKKRTSSSSSDDADATTDTSSALASSAPASEHGDHLDRDAPVTLNAVQLKLNSDTGTRTSSTSNQSSRESTSQRSPNFSPLLSLPDSSSLSSVPGLSSASSSDLSVHNSPLSPPLSEPPSSNNTSPASHSRILLDTASLFSTGTARTAPSIKLDNPDSSAAQRNSTSSPSLSNNSSTLNADPLQASDMDNQGGGSLQAQPPHPQTHVPHAANGKGGCWYVASLCLSSS